MKLFYTIILDFEFLEFFLGSLVRLRGGVYFNEGYVEILAPTGSEKYNFKGLFMEWN